MGSRISISIIISISGIMTTVTNSSSVIGGATTARGMQTAAQLPVIDHVKRRATIVVMDEVEEEEEQEEEEEEEERCPRATVHDTAAALPLGNRSHRTDAMGRCDRTMREDDARGRCKAQAIEQTTPMNIYVNSRQRNRR